MPPELTGPEGKLEGRRTPPHLRNVKFEGGAASHPPPRATSSGPPAQGAWRMRKEARVKFGGFPRAFVSTQVVWTVFARHGVVDSIELFIDRDGKPEGTGIVVFK